jgi:hypothetical protein
VHLEGKGHSDYRRRSEDRGAMARLFASEGATVALLVLTESQGPATFRTCGDLRGLQAAVARERSTQRRPKTGKQSKRIYYYARSRRS